jgi:uncharacterized protein YndB with AHSA1/START domain
MEKQHYSIVISASKEKVWKTMLDKDTYEKWTEVFMPGSSYVGDWAEGSKILFLAPDETGEMSGMISRIKENRQYDYISMESVGIVISGKEDTSSQEAKKWAGSFENYTLKDLDGKTEVRVDLTSDMDIDQDMLEMAKKTWPKALNILKKLAEES